MHAWWGKSGKSPDFRNNLHFLRKKNEYAWTSWGILYMVVFHWHLTCSFLPGMHRGVGVNECHDRSSYPSLMCLYKQTLVDLTFPMVRSFSRVCITRSNSFKNFLLFIILSQIWMYQHIFFCRGFEAEEVLKFREACCRLLSEIPTLINYYSCKMPPLNPYRAVFMLWLADLPVIVFRTDGIGWHHEDTGWWCLSMTGILYVGVRCSADDKIEFHPLLVVAPSAEWGTAAIL
jgi:hypothetical protein